MNRIQVSPEIHFGKPCVAGTRIPVQAVLELAREAIPFESIIRDYYRDLILAGWHSSSVCAKACFTCEFLPKSWRQRMIC
jgi:hypothetical protein